MVKTEYGHSGHLFFHFFEALNVHVYCFIFLSFLDIADFDTFFRISILLFIASLALRITVLPSFFLNEINFLFFFKVNESPPPPPPPPPPPTDFFFFFSFFQGWARRGEKTDERPQLPKPSWSRTRMFFIIIFGIKIIIAIVFITHEIVMNILYLLHRKIVMVFIIFTHMNVIIVMFNVNVILFKCLIIVYCTINCSISLLSPPPQKKNPSLPSVCSVIFVSVCTCTCLSNI